MRREDVFMDILSDLNENFVTMAMPRRVGDTAAVESQTVSLSTHIDEYSTEITKKDRVIYWVTRGLGMAAAAFLIIGAAVLLIMNWDKIAVKEPDRPGVVTNTTEISENSVSVTTSESTATTDIKDYINEIIEGYAYAEEWGITAHIIKADRYGISYGVSREGSDRYEGDIRYSDAYYVEKNVDGKWENIITQYDDMNEHTLPYYGYNEHELRFEMTLEPGNYRLLLLFDGFADKSKIYPDIAKVYLEFDVYPVRKTFDVQYYLKDDLAGMTAGAAYPFENGICADNTGFEKMNRSASCIGFFASEHKDLPDDLVETLKQYSDGDDLRYDFGGRLPALRTYKLFDDTELLQKSYRVNDEYLITVNDTGKIQFYRKSSSYTDARKAIELLWEKHDSMYPFEVFAVRENRDYDPEYLMIVASDSYDARGENVDALGQIKQMLDEAGVLDWDGGFVFMTPEQLRETWIPVEIIDTYGRLDGSYKRVADRVFHLLKSENMTFDEYKKFLADNGVIDADAARETVFELGSPVTPYLRLLDILDIQASDNNIITGYEQITDEIIHFAPFNADSNSVYVYDKALSQAVWKTVRLRMLQELCPQIKKLDLVVGSEPDEYRIIVHASEEDQEILKNNEAFKMFYDPDITDFAE